MEETLFSEIPVTSDVAEDVIAVAEPVPIDMGSISGGIQNDGQFTTIESGMFGETDGEMLI